MPSRMPTTAATMNAQRPSSIEVGSFSWMMSAIGSAPGFVETPRSPVTRFLMKLTYCSG